MTSLTLSLPTSPIGNVILWMALISWGTIFRGFRGGSTNSSTQEMVILCMIYERKYYGHEFEPQECGISVQSTKIGTHKNKAIHCSTLPTSQIRNFYPLLQPY